MCDVRYEVLSHLSRVALAHQAHFPEGSSSDHRQRFEVGLRQTLPPLADGRQAL